MERFFYDFKTALNENKFCVVNKYLNKVFKKNSFFLITKNNQSSIISKIKIFNKIQQKSDQQTIFISEYLENKNKCNFNSDFFLICFNNRLIIIEQTEIDELYQFFSHKKGSTIYTNSTNINNFFKQNSDLQIKIENKIENVFFETEIQSLLKGFRLKKIKTNSSIKQVLQLMDTILKSISGYLISKSHYKLKNTDRFLCFKEYFEGNKETKEDINKKVIKEDEYIELQYLTHNTILIYHFKSEDIFLLKIFFDENADDLFERENSNYKILNFPFFPRYLGKTKFNWANGIIIEFIQGNLLSDINEMSISFNNKIKIIFQIMLAIQYLHYNGYIYRDLKPNNIMINENFFDII